MNFDGWILAFNGAQTLVGKYDGGCLEPVYQLNTGTRMSPDGRSVVGVSRVMILPDFIDVPRLYFAARPPNCPVSDLSEATQRELARGIEMAEAMRLQIRAGEAGLILPGAK